LNGGQALQIQTHVIDGRSAERRAERQLIQDYESDDEHAISLLDTGNIEVVISLIQWPEEVRGFDPIKKRAIKKSICAAGTY